jgi:hypothetical protein
VALHDAPQPDPRRRRLVATLDDDHGTTADAHDVDPASDDADYFARRLTSANATAKRFPFRLAA